ncbi:DUF5719 family protein [Microbacterium sp. 3J1]|uniref:DUF5719 family protein n=1 Tax=Microbacterium sp. 3J1 TaxID=861269 RepID=UPI000A467F33|nr:DUF5719 family protein [Microbacterium sp. 3J1]
MNGTRAFRVAATSARVLTGAVVAAACVVGVIVAVGAPWPTIAHEPAQAEVTPLPGDTVLVCNGDLRAIGRTTSRPLEMVSAASPRVTVDGTSGAPESTPLAVEDLVDGGDVQRLTGVVEGRTAPELAATESVSIAAPDLFGFASAPCRPASTESWLVGGTVATGTEDLVVLTNPGAVPSTVTLEVFGSVRGSRSVIVPAETQLALPLTSMATGAGIPVVKVTATGSPVRAVLQSSLTRTLDPAGVDLQDAVAAPQKRPVIAGVQMFESEGDNAEMTVLRMLAPEADTQASVTVREVGETTAADEFSVPLIAGQPQELSLSSLSPGTYSVHIDAEAPVLAAVRVQDGAGPQTDFTWITPAPELEEQVLVAVPDGPAAELMIVNDGDEEATVRIETVDGGEPQELTVSAQSSASVEVTDRTVYSVSASSPVHAAVTMTAAGALAAWPVWPAAGAQQSITVYP